MEAVDSSQEYVNGKRLLAEYRKGKGSCEDPSPGEAIVTLTGSRSDHEMAAITRENATKSPFLRLPAELRLRIYELLFAGNMYHVRVSSAGFDTAEAQEVDARETMLKQATSFLPVFKTYCCVAPFDEEAAYRRSIDRSLNEMDQKNPHDPLNSWRYGDPFHIDCCVQRHAHCWDMGEPIDLRLLRACKQVYYEARDIPIQGNCYSFYEFQPFWAFTLALGSRRAALLRDLHIHRFTTGLVPGNWLPTTDTYLRQLSVSWKTAANIPNLVASLSSLRTLRLCITVPFNFFVDIFRPQAPTRREIWHADDIESWYLDGLMDFAKLSLEHVTVIVSESYYFNSTFTPVGKLGGTRSDSLRNIRNKFCLTAEEKRNLAEDIRKILQPRAARSSASRDPADAGKDTAITAEMLEGVGEQGLVSDALLAEMEMGFSDKSSVDVEMTDRFDEDR